MTQFFDAISELIADHWMKFVVAAAFTGLGWLLSWWRTKKAWQQREFFHRVNFSLNSIVDETLRIRTLAEKSCEDVFLNSTAVAALVAAAQKTKAGLPIIPLAQEDYWFYLNSVLNELSEQFSAGLIARDAGNPVKSLQYVICLTNEADGDVRTRKLRAIVIQKDLLLALPKQAPKFESPNHRIRWETLMHMAQELPKNPDKFLDVEIVV